MLIHTHASTPPAQMLASLYEHGYLIVPGLIDQPLCERVHEALAPYIKKELFGRNDFEGYRSQRIYALLAKSGVFAELVAHPLAMTLARDVLGANFLLSGCLAINLQPGESPQPLHFDDAFYPISRPRESFSFSTFWAIDEFTADNGATEFIPGSHRWGDEPELSATLDASFEAGSERSREQLHPQLQPAIVPQGSFMACLGTLWHRGGANRSDRPRLAVTPQYCVAWARQQENMSLAVPPDVAASYPEAIRELLGYNIHPPFMGHVDGVHPARRLEGREKN